MSASYRRTLRVVLRLASGGCLLRRSRPCSLVLRLAWRHSVSYISYPGEGPSFFRFFCWFVWGFRGGSTGFAFFGTVIQSVGFLFTAAAGYLYVSRTVHLVCALVVGRLCATWCCACSGGMQQLSLTYFCIPVMVPFFSGLFFRFFVGCASVGRRFFCWVFLMGWVVSFRVR